MNYTIEVLKPEEISALLALQKENLKINLDTETIDSQGFVTFVYNPEIIADMMTEPQIIAKFDDTIIGYALTTALTYARKMTLMRPLAELAETLTYQNTPLSSLRYYIIGQVCVRAGFRGIGVFDALYDGHRQLLASRYDCCITEIDWENKRSLAAHKRIGFEIIHEYFDPTSQKKLGSRFA
ncbi:MAG: GNAT family N-acetyltransferase [Saprospiraceae bacterium]|nr:GNAT family N-acetyltransferase [Saprospiraceae bacterium]